MVYGNGITRMQNTETYFEFKFAIKSTPETPQGRFLEEATSGNLGIQEYLRIVFGLTVRLPNLEKTKQVRLRGLISPILKTTLPRNFIRYAMIRRSRRSI